MTPREPRGTHAGFLLLRRKGNHQIYGREKVRIVVPFHSGKALHPKIVKQVMKTIESAQ